MEPEYSLPHLQAPLTCPYSESNPIHAFPSHFFKIHFNIIVLYTTSLISGLFHSGLATKTLYEPFLSSIRAAYSAWIIFLYFSTPE